MLQKELHVKIIVEKFIEFLLSKESQENLKEIGMFSLKTQLEYDNVHLSQMQNVIQSKTVSAFITKHDLDNLSEHSLAFLNGEKEWEIKIKNMLI